jgi:hypothetical protein
MSIFIYDKELEGWLGIFLTGSLKVGWVFFSEAKKFFVYIELEG